jgi:hypothetical protein
MFRILEPFFHALSDGKVIRLIVAWVLRVFSVLGALGGVFWFLAFIAIGFKAYDGGGGTRAPGILVGSLLFALFGLALGYLWLGIGLFRARTILALGDSHFTVLSILSILFRLNGELIFVSYSLIGVGGCLFVWMTDFSPLSQFGPLQGQIPFGIGEASGFIGGIELAALMLLLAFVGIVVSYALAELSIVLVEIALNTRGIPAMAGAGLAATVSLRMPTVPTGVSRTASVARPVQTICRECGNPLDSGSAFCAECGKAVTANGN